MEAAFILMLAGDVMLGRGIDQIQAHSVEPTLYEPYVKSARRYVDLAEEASGPIPENVDAAYVWHDALPAIERFDPSVSIVNLETAVTTHDRPWPGKGIHYRMHPKNVGVLAAAGVDVAVLANNHTLDWGRPGLTETLGTLEQAEITPVGAGGEASAAAAPAFFRGPDDHRVAIFAYATPSSGVMRNWQADGDTPGVNILHDLSDASADAVVERINAHRKDGDVVVFSVHWGGNWGYDIADEQRRFAHRLIDEAGVDLVFGHSSHHPKGIEVYHDRLILYGAGDLINDYEGIGGHDRFRPDLTLMYFPQVDPDTGQLVGLRLTPFRIEKFRLNAATSDEATWLAQMLSEQSEAFGVTFSRDPEAGDLIGRWR